MLWNIVFNLFLYLQQIRFIYVLKSLKEKNYMANKYFKAILFFAFLIIIGWCSGSRTTYRHRLLFLPIDGGILGLLAIGNWLCHKKDPRPVEKIIISPII